MTQEIEVVNVNAAMVRGEIDAQIATAKQYPRDLPAVQNRILQAATISPSVAEKCFYSLPRDGKVIEGPTVRFAEIVATQYGNLRIQTRIIDVTDAEVVAQGIAHDLESNVAISCEVRKGILNKHGVKYSAQMIITTANAAGSFAFRNAVFKTVPRALTDMLADEIKKASLGDDTLEAKRDKAIGYFKKEGITEKQICGALGVKKIADIGEAEILTLRGILNAVEEGATNYTEAFAKKAAELKSGKNKI